MTRARCTLSFAALAAIAGTATASPRVAVVDPARVAFDPASLVATYEQARADLVAVARAVAPDPDWMVDVADSLTSRFGDAVAGSRAWLIRGLAPLAPPPPDLTALVAYPIPGATTSGYGWRDDPINHHDQFHAGADIHAAHGTPVYAAGAGSIVFAGRQHGYGNIIYVDHGAGLITRYAHLSKILVKVGDAVTGGDEIGRVGATGRATGPHLHFEVRIDGRPVAPALAMQVADLERTDPDLARLIGVALDPDVQSQWINEQDPPRRHGPGHKAPHPSGSRPERRGRAPRSHDNS